MDGGAVRVIDFMPVRDDAVDLVRIVEGISGEVTMQMELVLRFDYGRVVPWVRHSKHGISAVAGPDSAYLTTHVPLEGRDKRTYSEFTVRAGDRVPSCCAGRRATSGSRDGSTPSARSPAPNRSGWNGSAAAK